MKPAIIAIGYNRVNSIKRLLSSLDKAIYNCNDIKLIISIDHAKSENDKKNLAVLKAAKDFEWRHGEKEIIYRDKNLGLRPHILACGDLVNQYDSIIMLEDDIFVSPMFYSYACSALNFCKDKKYIAGVSLYNHKFNFQISEPFYPIEDGYDNWYFKFPQSWGQAWTKEQWTGFRAWYDSNYGKTIASADVPASVSSWPETSWMKYFLKYMLSSDKFLFYPKCSFTTNSCDAGTNSDSAFKDLSYQVPTVQSFDRDFCFSDISQSSAVYDQFFENLSLNKYLRIQSEELTVDLFGHKPVPEYGYLLSRKHLDFKIEQSFSCSQKPHELNIINNIEGENFFLYNLSKKVKNKFPGPKNMPLTYNYQGLNLKNQIRVVFFFMKNVLSALKRKSMKIFK